MSEDHLPPNAQDAIPSGETTHFGFRDVPVSEKPALVGGVFRSVASRYDLMNDLMSGGLHRHWKEVLIDRLVPRPGMTLLDVAGGTGDVSLRFLKRLKGQGRATICDFTAAMLHEGRARPDVQPYAAALQWVCGDATALPFPDQSFDAYTISFGIRNVTRIEAALAEAYRVLKPGGRFLCLEFSHCTTPLLQWVYDRYSFNLIPPLGKLVAGDADSYQYLVESIRKFPNQIRFAQMITGAGFARVGYENMTQGIVALHSGWRL